ncbi:cupin domain-containing protein [Alkaliphilus pronyensis]|uniref:Cupin domain-containing protein n=1 Tax=Alkaliphilus pronyensis TaxID=1482732 RepID=A0A6I0F7B7_9FIRM|nr:cupin domain-containing protein [Alkaliphilus pronyensis]KAB3534086.1 cupin domain-containing protein [Alkaliphilus pronyensis]
MNKIKLYEIKLNDAKELGIDTWNRWQCEESSFDWEYPEEETAYVYEGEVIVTTTDERVHIKENMLVTFPRGLKCHWEVKKRIDKVYTFNFDEVILNNIK